MDEQRSLHSMRRDLSFLKGYAILSSAILGIFWFSGFTQSGDKRSFEEIDAERINIIAKDGSLRLVLTNKERAPDLIVKGQTMKRASGAHTHGIIFYNDQGDESGALFTSSRRDESGRYFATSRLVFDQFEDDETLSLQYVDENGRRYAGLAVMDRPETPVTDEIREEIRAMWRMPDGPEKNKVLEGLRSRGVFDAWRVFVGKGTSKSSVVTLYDRNGKARVRLSVDSLGTPGLSFFDDMGRVTYRLPDSARVTR